MVRFLYVGSRNDGPMSGAVAVRDADMNAGGAALPPRLDVRRHSPDGFEWGYGGSGPAQLSLALLLHTLDSEAITDLTPCGDCEHEWRQHVRAHDMLLCGVGRCYDCVEFISPGKARALKLYMRSKFVVVSAITADDWTLSSRRVRAIADSLEANHDAIADAYVAESRALGWREAVV